MTTLALVPAKTLARAKSRLAGVAGVPERETAALDMLRAVLERLASLRRHEAPPAPAGELWRTTPALDGYAVVTGDPRAAALASELGAEIVAEPRDGLNLALDTGRAWAIERGAGALLVVLSDLPLALAADLEDVIAHPASVVIAPSKDGGTNALLLRPPDAIPFRFGRDSASYHRFEAEKRGLEVGFVARDSLAFDVDTPEDLALYRASRQRALARP